MKKVLVIIVSYNGMKWMEKCLCSVSLSHMPADVFVVDNGSTDGTPEFIEEEFPDVKLERFGRNLGFGQGNNIGMKYAVEKSYEYVYLLNQDAWLEPETLGTLVRAFEESFSRNERFGILSPMQKNALDGRMDGNFIKWYRISGPITESGIKEMEFVMAAHWMICRDCLKDTGGFSPTFTQYGEDDNYIHRARYFGWKTGAVNEAFAVHDRNCSAISREKSMRLKCVAQIVKLSDPGACLPLRKVIQPLELLGISIRRMSLIPLKYIPELVRNYPEISRNRQLSMQKGAFLE